MLKMLYNGGMRKFLYEFGYMAPEKRGGKACNLYNDEASEMFIILANTKEEALKWGLELSEKYYAALYEGEEGVSWLDDAYHYSITEDYADLYTPEQLKNIPEVKVGECPDFKGIIDKKYPV